MLLGRLRLTGCFVGWLDASEADWLLRWLVGCLAGQYADRPVGWLFCSWLLVRPDTVYPHAGPHLYSPYRNTSQSSTAAALAVSPAAEDSLPRTPLLVPATPHATIATAAPAAASCATGRDSLRSLHVHTDARFGQLPPRQLRRQARQAAGERGGAVLAGVLRDAYVYAFTPQNVPQRQLVARRRYKRRAASAVVAPHKAGRACAIVDRQTAAAAAAAAGSGTAAMQRRHVALKLLLCVPACATQRAPQQLRPAGRRAARARAGPHSCLAAAHAAVSALGFRRACAGAGAADASLMPPLVLLGCSCRRARVGCDLEDGVWHPVGHLPRRVRIQAPHLRSHPPTRGHTRFSIFCRIRCSTLDDGSHSPRLAAADAIMLTRCWRWLNTLICLREAR
eukprot:363666-Chlamydomonas_euryale.AAC.3